MALIANVMVRISFPIWFCAKQEPRHGFNDLCAFRRVVNPAGVEGGTPPYLNKNRLLRRLFDRPATGIAPSPLDRLESHLFVPGSHRWKALIFQYVIPPCRA